MSPVHLGVGAVCAAAVVGLLAWLQFRQEPTDQHFAFTNAYQDARCVMNFSDGSKHRFSVKKDNRYQRTFKAPKIGFVIMRCATVSGLKEGPGHLRLVEGGGQTDVTFNPQGEIDARNYPARTR